jgi:hypothetical protein
MSTLGLDRLRAGHRSPTEPATDESQEPTDDRESNGQAELESLIACGNGRPDPHASTGARKQPSDRPGDHAGPTLVDPRIWWLHPFLPLFRDFQGLSIIALEGIFA